MERIEYFGPEIANKIKKEQDARLLVQNPQRLLMEVERIVETAWNKTGMKKIDVD